MFYNDLQLSKLGFKSVGKNVLLSDKCSIYNPSNISIGDNVRIDDFCVISAGVGGIKIGNYVHIAVYCSLIGDGEIIFEDFSGLSSRVSVFSSSEDYSGEFLTNPTIDKEYRKLIIGDVRIGKHVVVGTGSTILPNVNIGDFSSIGAMSLVNKSVDECKIVVGIPAKVIKNRSKKLIELECEFLKKQNITI
jgi:acetyltransferase-like isoleucine patch superfamily enzyme